MLPPTVQAGKLILLFLQNGNRSSPSTWILRETTVCVCELCQPSTKCKSGGGHDLTPELLADKEPVRRLGSYRCPLQGLMVEFSPQNPQSERREPAPSEGDHACPPKIKNTLQRKPAKAIALRAGGGSGLTSAGVLTSQ